MIKNIKGKVRSKALLAIAILVLVFLANAVYSQDSPFEFPINESVEIEIIDPQLETECIGDICEATYYSYEKYWYNDEDEWEEIDENWHSCAEGFCTEEYYFRVQASDQGVVSAIVDGEEFTMQLTGISGLELGSFEPEMSGSLLTYENIVPDYIDLQYQYLPQMLKEDVIIKQPLDLESDFNITFNISGEAEFIIPISTMCDSNGTCVEIPHIVNDNEMIIQVPISFLNGEGIQYPIYVDPTIVLDDSSIYWNSRVFKDPLAELGQVYTRTTNLRSYQLGLINGVSGSTARASIEWNLSYIPNNVAITNATLQLFVESTGLPASLLNLTHMGGLASSYPNTNDTCEGNCNFYNDMGNGTVYGNDSSLQGTNFYVNITLNADGRDAIEDALVSDIFAFGLSPSFNNPLDISAKDNTNSSRRPRLTITFIDAKAPDISFVSPTPSNDSAQTGNSIFVNVSSTDLSDHYTLLDFNYDLDLFMRMDDLNSSGDPTDSSTYSRNGTGVADASQTSLGYFGEGFAFDGSGDSINLSAGEYVNITGKNTTLSLWFKTGNPIIKSLFTSSEAVSQPYWVLGSSTTGILFLNIANATAQTGWPMSSSALNDSQWHHAVVVMRDTGSQTNVTSYIDGNLNKSQLYLITGNKYSGSAPTIGRFAGYGSFNGTIDEVMIFDRDLTMIEAKALYNASANKYANNFTSLSEATYKFRGYSSDKEGSKNQTEERVVTIGSIANEAQGDAAIALGINNSLPYNPIASEKQVYLYQSSNQQYLGRFDKVTVKNNQTWAFNYVTSGESTVAIPSSFFNTLNVWQNSSSLISSQIISQVQNFIDTTIN